jgi:spore coat polysaccharide biosynthesis predicted glycosyltransferase SpsG
MPFQVSLLTNVEDMAELMAWADVAVSAGGTTVWELAFMGLPFIGVSQGPQEELLLRWSTRAGFSIHLGKSREVGAGRIAQALAGLLRNENQRRAMSATGRGFVDGLGASRIIEIMKG